MSDNRVSGHNWERYLANLLTDRFGFLFKTSRQESRTKDNQKIDLVCIDCEEEFPVEFQAKEQTIKAEAKSFSIKVEALDQMETEMERALLVKIWKKGKGKSRRKHHKNYMVVELEFGLKLIEAWNKHLSEH